MTVKNTLKGGTDFTEEGLRPTDLNDTFNSFYRKAYIDSTTYTVDGDSGEEGTTETDMGSVTIPQNDLGTSASLIISAEVQGEMSDSNRTCDIRLYVGGVVQKTVTFNFANDSNFSNMLFLDTAVNTATGNVIVKLTAQWDGTAINPGNNVITCRALLIDGVYNNS